MCRRSLANELGSRDGGGVDAHLVCAKAQQAPRVLERTDAAAHGQRYENLLRSTRDDIQHRLAPLGGGRYVVEHDLVSTLGVVTGCELHGVAGVAEPREAHPFDHTTSVDVQARDNSHGSHSGLIAVSCGSPARGGHRVGDAEASFSTGAAHDRSRQAPASNLQAGQAAKVVERPGPTGRDQGYFAGPQQGAVAGHVRSEQQPVAAKSRSR